MKAGRDIYQDELLADIPEHTVVPCEPMDSEDLLYILYTSGSTGKPKGVVHVQGGYAVGTYATTKFVFDKASDVFWCTADIGWVTGHSYIMYGPLINAATGILFEGIPTYPAPDRFWEIVEKFKGTIFYTAPTAIRSLMRFEPGQPPGRCRSGCHRETRCDKRRTCQSVHHPEKRRRGFRRTRTRTETACTFGCWLSRYTR